MKTQSMKEKGIEDIRHSCIDLLEKLENTSRATDFKSYNLEDAKNTLSECISSLQIYLDKLRGEV